MDQKSCFLITGKLIPEYIDGLIYSYKHTDNKIISTWENEDQDSINKLKANNFIVILNSLKHQNINDFRPIPIVNGINYAKKNGYEYILKSRTDIVSSNFIEYLKIVQQLYTDKITVISGIETIDGIYFLDIIVSGKTDDMENFFTIKYADDNRFIEKFVLESYINKTNLTKVDIRNHIHFSKDLCLKHNIDFIWYRNSSWKNAIRTIPDMKVINEYCKDTFIWI